MAEERSDLARVTLSVILTGALIAGAFWIVRPFLGAFIWATMIVVATWPILLWVERLLWGRRRLAAAVMCLALLGVLLVPLGVAIDAILRHADGFPELAARLVEVSLPPPPSWLAGVPVVGPYIAEGWHDLAGARASDIASDLRPYVRDAVEWVIHRAGGFAAVIVQFVVIVILAALLYANGETWAAWARRFGARLAEAQGERMVVLAGDAIRGVALGVVVTAVVQSLLGGLGFAIAGVPFAPVLTAVMFMLCVAQIGPVIVLAGGTTWVWFQFGSGWGAFLLLWSAVVGFLDNFLRPALIRRGADLPLPLIVGGVIGGLVSFGIVGIFIGPVILAVAFTLLDDWVRRP
ncbi:MAG: AI-2E family transporter YdiK [Deltaproteobacteria bacterium]|nr:AI-2E family transporter YdiK [Deltaproteobacteria bacterium]